MKLHYKDNPTINVFGMATLLLIVIECIIYATGNLSLKITFIFAGVIMGGVFCNLGYIIGNLT